MVFLNSICHTVLHADRTLCLVNVLCGAEKYAKFGLHADDMEFSTQNEKEEVLDCV
jgi:hypothetical protein